MTPPNNSTQSSDPPADIPPPPDQSDWDEAAEQFLLDLLKNVQASASVWSGAAAALLGLFGTVALVTGPSDITKLGPDMKCAAIILTLAAGVLAGAALLLLTLAQQLPSVSSENWNGSKYRGYVTKNAGRARCQLNWGRILGILAGAVVFALGVAVLIAAS
ncbi:MAG TPA: hypothetical protein VMA73_11920 [Streptosporangiaceae bacterium]|nr:hypothetical protein [Streptosporangiaceae bacterium]